MYNIFLNETTYGLRMRQEPQGTPQFSMIPPLPKSLEVLEILPSTSDVDFESRIPDCHCIWRTRGHLWNHPSRLHLQIVFLKLQAGKREERTQKKTTPKCLVLSLRRFWMAKQKYPTTCYLESLDMAPHVGYHPLIP